MTTRIPHNGSPVTTACVGQSADIFPGILRFYVPEGGRVLDMNWGKGRFWKRVDPQQYEVFGVDVDDALSSDTAGHCLARADNAALPFREDTFDACILDPAFGTGSTKPQTIGTAKSYNLKPMANYDIDLMQLYRKGMAEAWRVLRNDGALILKCQDVINNGRFQPNHYRLYHEAWMQGFTIAMTYVLVGNLHPIMRHDYQMNPRANHSYFQVFRKES